MALLEVRGLAREPFFPAQDLAVADGEVCVLSGPSGSGKSLFLRAIADLDPAAGEVALDGAPRSSFRAPAWRARVLYVHQSGVRFPGTVRENLERFARGRPAPVPPGLAADADALRLSGGEAQALALARALLCEPTVLLLDEPTSSMDEGRARAWERELVAWAGGGGRAIVWITHEAGLADRLGARLRRFP